MIARSLNNRISLSTIYAFAKIQKSAFNSKYKYWGILKISESVGSFAGMAGLKYYEYHPKIS